MRRYWIAGRVVIAALALLGMLGVRRVVGQRVVSGAEKVVTMSVGASALLVYDAPVARFSIGELTVADANVVSPKEVLVTGKKLGTTSLLVWDNSGAVRVYSVEVTADAPALERYLHGLFPRDSIAVAASSNTVTLTGRVSSPNVDRQIQDIAKATGAVVIDQLQAPPGRQVLLQVEFAEVNRDAIKQMSTILSTLNPNHFAHLVTDSAETVSDGLMQLFLADANSQFSAAIKALRATGDFKSLAEPNLLTLPGQEASFLAGGEFPYPSVQNGAQNGSVTIVFKEFGIRLRFTPTITEGGSIRLHVAPEVSSLDFANALTLNGFQIPSLLTRRAETDVELRDGQHLAIAGLMDNTLLKNVSKIPVLGDLPIIGTFFRTTDSQQRRTELLVVVTPRLVEASDTAPALPTGPASSWPWDPTMKMGPGNH